MFIYCGSKQKKKSWQMRLAAGALPVCWSSGVINTDSTCISPRAALTAPSWRAAGDRDGLVTFDLLSPGRAATEVGMTAVSLGATGEGPAGPVSHLCCEVWGRG